MEDYNDFAEALEDIWQQDGLLLTYAAVLEAEKPETLHRACELLQDLDNYQRITEGAYGYGQQRLQDVYKRQPQSLAKVFQTEQAARDYLSDCDSIIIIDL